MEIYDQKKRVTEIRHAINSNLLGNLEFYRVLTMGHHQPLVLGIMTDFDLSLFV